MWKTEKDYGKDALEIHGNADLKSAQETPKKGNYADTNDVAIRS
jgi:hypothetical protein